MSTEPNNSDPARTHRKEPRGLDDPLNAEADTDDTSLEKLIQQRQRSLHAILPTYKDSVNIHEYVSEVKTHCDNSGLEQHRGRIISAIMNKCPMGTFLGRRLRASLKETEQQLIRDHVQAISTQESRTRGT